MSHLDEGTLHALLDGEIPSAELPAVEQHLAHCRECQARMEEARAFRNEAFGLIESLDESEPIESATVAAGSSLMFDAPAAEFAAYEAPTPDYGAPAAKRADPESERRGSERSDGRKTRRDRPFPRWARPLAWAATIVLAVGIGYSWRGRDNPDGAGVSAASEQATDARSFAVHADSAPERTADAITPAAPAARPREASSAQESPPATSRAAAPAEDRSVPRQEAAPQATVSAQAADREAAKAAPAPAPKVSASPSLDRMAAARRRTDDTTRLLPIERPIALSEVVTAGFAPRTPSISADSAIRMLGGSIRLIDGWNPDRYELMDSTVRVVYQTSYGEVTLEQWRTERAVGHQLITPPEAPADSVAAWRSRIR